jgi:anaerobic selenocysteine-containing dehydrogenase
MDDLSRRDFLKKGSIGVAAGAVALQAGGAVTKAVSAQAAERTSRGASTDTPAPEAAEAIVAYVRPGSRGEVHLMVGDNEVVQHDRELASRIIRASQS